MDNTISNSPLTAVMESSAPRVELAAHNKNPKTQTGSPASLAASPETAEAAARPLYTQDESQSQEKLRHALETMRMEYGVKVETASDDRGKIFVRIMSQDGERVLRQMPPDSLLKLHASLKHNRGMLGDWLA